MTRRTVKPLVAGFVAVGMLLAPAHAIALPPLPGDRDADGVSDQDEINVYHTNPDVRDTDGDGLNDGNEINNEKSNPLSTDSDNDGLSDNDEYYKYHTMLILNDTDQDGITDLDEINSGTNPLNHSDPGPKTGGNGGGAGQNRADTDQDGLFDDDEVNLYGTNPKKADTDGDGRDDGQEVFDNTDPNNRFG
jgi:hypothetical protein